MESKISKAVRVSKFLTDFSLPRRVRVSTKLL